MKTLLTLLVALTLASTVQAQIGWTMDECVTHWGNPSALDYPVFSVGGPYTIDVCLRNRTVAQYSYNRSDTYISLSEAQRIFSRDSGGPTWKMVYKNHDKRYGWEISWKTADGKRWAIYDKGSLTVRLDDFDVNAVNN